MVSGPIFAVTVAGTAVSILGVETVLRRVRRIYRESRENEDALLRSFQSTTAGIKELKLHRGRRQDFMDRHLLGAAGELRDQNVAAGTQCRARPRLRAAAAAGDHGCHPVRVRRRRCSCRGHVMVSYILVTMFLAMPMHNFMKRIPDLLARRCRAGQDPRHEPPLDQPATMSALPLRRPPGRRRGTAGTDRRRATPIRWKWPRHRGAAAGRLRAEPPAAACPHIGAADGFRLGPVDLVFEPGQITFIVGGNGSGKSTLAKLMTGLYAPDTGSLKLNGEKIGHTNIEWFRQNCSAVFTDFHLFEDYLGFDRPGSTTRCGATSGSCSSTHNVTVQDGRLSTVALSHGQRKRLALLTALLEDRPIYVFDEWAADQEPRFREVFYTEILAGLKQRGKTVVVITHDDRYFHCADQIVKLDFGQIAAIEAMPIRLLRAGRCMRDVRGSSTAPR